MKKTLFLILIFSTQLVFSQNNLKNPDYLIDFPSQNAVINKKYEAYRFVWLRTFQNPISVLLEKTNNDINLFWIVGKGSSGFQHQGIKQRGKRSITIETFDYFKDLLKLAEFENLPDTNFIIMLDGSSWVLEQKTQETYKSHRTNNPDKNFQIACIYLIELAGINYDKAYNYSEYRNIRIYLNDKNEIIRKEDIISKVISHLNNFVTENKLKDKWCYYPDYIVTIHPNGRITSVKNAPDYEGLFERISYWFETYQCRKEFSRIVRSIDFSHFNFKNKANVYISLNFNKEHNVFFDDE